MDHPIVVVGAGASGLMAAVWAAGRGAPVVLLEGTADGGRKIVLSGGGRCNVLPAAAAPERFVTDSSPNTLRKILRAWPLDEQRAFFERELGLPLRVEEESGKLFPASNKARDVRDRLFAAARERGVEIRCGARVADLVPRGEAADDEAAQKRVGAADDEAREDGDAAKNRGAASESGARWTVRLDDGAEIAAASVIVAAGGLSFPSTGSDGWGFEAARRLGHAVHAPYPALTPLLARPAVHAHLAGISLEVALDVPGPRKSRRFAGGFLFTHHGYSGPAVLDASHLAVRSRLAGGERQPIFVRWTELDAAAWDDELRGGRGAVETIVARRLPARLAETLCREAGLPDGLPATRLPRENRLRLVESLVRYRLPWTGDEGYAKAEATGGGVDLGEVDPRTMESRLRRGLFFCGEVLDAVGPIGGHNFQWAWSTGRAAGLGAAARSAAQRGSKPTPASALTQA